MHNNRSITAYFKNCFLFHFTGKSVTVLPQVLSLEMPGMVLLHHRKYFIQHWHNSNVMGLLLYQSIEVWELAEEHGHNITHSSDLWSWTSNAIIRRNSYIAEIDAIAGLKSCKLWENIRSMLLHFLPVSMEWTRNTQIIILVWTWRTEAIHKPPIGKGCLQWRQVVL